jgi:hypothetical protein
MLLRLLTVTAGGIMLQAGAHTNVEDTTIEDCTALAGGGVCTAMADDASKELFGTIYDRKTQLSLDVTFSNNAGGHVLAGPYFELKFAEPAQPNATNWYSKGVKWWTRLCDMGEYLSTSSGFCQVCPGGTYLLKMVDARGARGHTVENCTTAPPTGYAPGGAILIAKSNHWHHPNNSWTNKTEPLAFPGCRDCHMDDPWRPDVEQILRWAG